MAKTKKKSKKRTVTCGKCGSQGHNSRSCGKEITEAKVEKGPITVEVIEVEEPEAPASKLKLPPTPPARQRPAPTADRGTAATAAPYRCQQCNSVAILVIVKVKDHNESFKKGRDIYKGETRCEQCMNKPNPADLILKWGATPGEKVSAEVANA